MVRTQLFPNDSFVMWPIRLGLIISSGHVLLVPVGPFGFDIEAGFYGFPAVLVFVFFKSCNPVCSLVPWQGYAIPQHPKGTQTDRKATYTITTFHSVHNPKEQASSQTYDGS